MTDTTQLLLMAVITIMTVLLTIIGVQLIFVLRDVRSILTKFNTIANEFERVGLNLGRGYSEMIGFVSSFKKLGFVLDLLSKKKKHKKNDEK